MAEETITILRVDGGSAITTIKELREYIRQLKNELSTLTVGTEDYQSKLGTLITAQNALRGAMNATSASMEDVATAAAGTGKSYNSLVNQMANLRRAQRSLNIETDEGKKQYAEMAVQINSLNDELKALDAQNGNYQRNVGNYKSAMDGLNIATAQIVRELPSAAIGINTFFLAISNNIPMLIDQISNLRKTGASVPQVISAIGKSLLSFNSLVTVAITLLTLYGDKIIEWISSLFRGRDAVDSVADSMDNLNKAMDFDSLGTQVAEFQRLAQAYRDVGDNASAKQKFLEDYREELDKTGLAIYDITDADNIFITNSEKVVEAYKLRAQALAGMQLASEQYAKALEQQSKAQENQAKVERLTRYRDMYRSRYKMSVSLYGEDSHEALNAKSWMDDYQKRLDDFTGDTFKTAGDAFIEGVNKLSATISDALKNAGIKVKGNSGGSSLMEELQKEMQSWNIEIPVTPVLDTDDGLLDSLENEDRQREFWQRRNDLQLENLQKQADQAQAWNQVMIGTDEERAERSYNIEQEYYQKRLELLERFHQEAMDNGDMESALEYEQQITDARSQIWLSYFTRLDELRKENQKKEEEDAKESEDNERRRRQAIIASVNAIGSVLGSLADMYEADAENSEEAARQAKNLRIAEATINTISGAVGAYMQAAGSIPPPWGIILGAAQAAAVLATGMAQIAKIRNTEINKDSAPSGSSSGISASVSAPTVTPQVSNVRNVTSASEEERLNQMASSQKVYILSSDIEASQRQRKVQVQESSF